MFPWWGFLLVAGLCVVAAAGLSALVVCLCRLCLRDKDQEERAVALQRTKTTLTSNTAGSRASASQRRGPARSRKDFSKTGVENRERGRWEGDEEGRGSPSTVTSSLVRGGDIVATENTGTILVEVEESACGPEVVRKGSGRSLRPVRALALAGGRQRRGRADAIEVGRLFSSSESDDSEISFPILPNVSHAPRAQGTSLAITGHDQTPQTTSTMPAGRPSSSDNHSRSSKRDDAASIGATFTPELRHFRFGSSQPRRDSLDEEPVPATGTNPSGAQTAKETTEPHHAKSSKDQLAGTSQNGAVADEDAVMAFDHASARSTPPSTTMTEPAHSSSPEPQRLTTAHLSSDPLVVPPHPMMARQPKRPPAPPPEPPQAPPALATSSLAAGPPLASAGLSHPMDPIKTTAAATHGGSHARMNDYTLAPGSLLAAASQTAAAAALPGIGMAQSLGTPLAHRKTRLRSRRTASSPSEAPSQPAQQLTLSSKMSPPTVRAAERSPASSPVAPTTKHGSGKLTDGPLTEGPDLPEFAEASGSDVVSSLDELRRRCQESCSAAAQSLPQWELSTALTEPYQLQLEGEAIRALPETYMRLRQ